MLPPHAGAGYSNAADDGHGVTATAVPPRANLDWMRDPAPTDLTPFQTFFRKVEWGNSSVGPMGNWPRELKQTVRMMMADTSPHVLYWGKDFTLIYNEAYTPLVGNKHPHMMGKNAPDIFPHFWDYFDNILTKQRLTGECLQGEADMLLMERNGFLEETYFDWKLIPLIGDDGEVKGAYDSPTDLTWDIIASRRVDCVKQLAQRIGKIKNLGELWDATMAGLSVNEKDTPFVLLYSVNAQTSLAAPPSRPNYTCRLETSIGVDADHVIAKQYLDAQYDLDGFAPKILEAFTTNELLVMEAADPQLTSLLDGIGWKGHGLPSHQLVILPLRSDDDIVAFFIIGLNPYRRYNELYQSFLKSMVEVLGPQVSKIKLSEEVQRRAEIARKATSDFEKSEERFTRFAGRSTIGLAVAGLDRQIVYANDAWYKFAGLDPNRTDYDGWLDSVYESDLPLVQEWWHKVVAEKKGGQFQFRSKLPFRQGHMYSEHKTALCAIYPDLNEAQDIETVMGLVIDISELKWIEDQLIIRTKALEESESKWRKYAEHCPLGIVRTDGEGHVQYGNDAWHACFGFSRGKVPGAQPWLPHVDEACIEKWQECFESFQKESGPRAMELKLKDRVYTVDNGEHVMENGVYVLITGFSEFKQDGTVDYIDFWVTDISPQKMAAKILADKVDEAVRLKTHQERFIDMISHEIRNPLSAVLHCGEEVIGAMKTLLDKIGKISTGVSCEDDQGRNVFVQQLQNALEAANTIMYCCQHQKQIVDDVLTLSKLDAELLVVSPVPIQPMNLVRTALKVFRPELKMTDVKLSIIEDVSLSKRRINWVLLDPNRFLQIVINIVTNAIKFTQTAPVREIVITVSASLEPPPENALGVNYVPRRYEAAKPTSPVGDLAREFDLSEEVYICFSVKDTGKGLTIEERALLFNRFQQASPKTHIEYGGSGLGLFISRQITEMLGGEIGMSSGGSGSTFAFYVKSYKASPPRRPSVSIEPILQITRTLSLNSSASPLVVPPSPEDRNRPAFDVTLVTPITGNGAGTSSAKRHVLVVEDNLVNQKVLCKLLGNRRFVVESANHGLEALTAIQNLRDKDKRGFDIILCDVEMPVMGGIEFAKEVRSREAIGQMPGHVPIIGVTANVRSQQVTAAIEAGMDGVTTKPYRIDDLIAHIDRVCSTTAAIRRGDLSR